MRCPKCIERNSKKIIQKEDISDVQKYGTYRRKSDSRTIQRFYCKRCRHTYSYALKDPAYNQKKRRVNTPLKFLLASSVSMRRAARLLRVSRTTIARKLRFLGRVCWDEHEEYLHNSKQKITEIQFDELQTIEHTKCKPLSVATVVSVKDRKILGITVASMPATGHLAKISRRKYGYRPDERQKKLTQLFEKITETLIEKPLIQSDMHPYYKPIINHFFPKANYHQLKGIQATVMGQGELKKHRKDPLFSINHTLAMLRANINRLIRKTWCTTKDPARLLDHLAIYMSVHNSILTA